MGYITWIEGGRTFSDWSAVVATSTGTSSGGLGGKDLTSYSTITLEQTGDVLGTVTPLSFTKSASTTIVIQAAGFNLANELAGFVPNIVKSTSNRPKIDCNGGDVGLNPNALGNITIQGLQFYNGGHNSSSSSMLKGTGNNGANLVRFNDWNIGAVACRWTGGYNAADSGPKADITFEYNNVMNHGFGCFRVGAGQTGNVVDIGNIIVRYNTVHNNRGYYTVAQRIALGQVFNPLLDVTATDANNTVTNHGCLVLKNGLSITANNNLLDGCGQFTIDFENTPQVDCYNNIMSNAGMGSSNGGVITITPNSGFVPACNIKQNLVTNSYGAFINTVGTGLLDVERNTIVEARKQVDSAANVIIAGNVKNVIVMSVSGSLRYISNLVIGNAVNNAAFLALGTTTTSFVTDYNSYDRQGNASRFYYTGTIGGTSINASTAATAQGQSSGDSNFATRDIHSHFSTGTTAAVTNPEIISQYRLRLPAPAANGSITYPIFSPYAGQLVLLDADSCIVTGIPTGTITANSTTNITVNGTAGQVPTLALNALDYLY